MCGADNGMVPEEKLLFSKVWEVIVLIPIGDIDLIGGIVEALIAICSEIDLLDPIAL